MNINAPDFNSMKLGTGFGNLMIKVFHLEKYRELFAMRTVNLIALIGLMLALAGCSGSGGSTSPAAASNTMSSSISSSMSSSSSSSVASSISSSSSSSSSVVSSSSSTSSSSSSSSSSTASIAYLRIDLSLASGQVNIQQVSPFSSAIHLQPQVGGGYALVGWKSGQVVTAVPFHFPTTLIGEGVDSNGNSISTAIDVSASSATSVNLPSQDVDQLTVVDVTGTTVVTMPLASATMQAMRASNRMHIAATAQAAAPTPLSGVLYAPAPSLTFMGATDLSAIPAVALPNIIIGLVNFSDLSQAGQNAIMMGLQQTAPGPLNAVSHLAFAKLNQTMALSTFGFLPHAYTQGSYVVFNADHIEDSDTPYAVVHEFAHAYNFKLDGDTSTPAWPQFVVQAASQDVPLGSNFTSFWQQMHNDGIANQLAGPYNPNNSGSSNQTESLSQATHDGFATPYGATAVAEDIAEYTARLQFPEGANPSGNTGPLLFCAQFNSAASFPVSQTIPYVKAQLLAIAGFITTDKLVQCIGSSTPPAEDAGVSLVNADNSIGMFIPVDTTNQNNKYSVSASGNGFMASGQDETDAASVNMATTLGWARLAKSGNFVVSGAINGASTDGLVYVSGVSSDNASLTVFNLELGMQVIPYATFNVPSSDPPKLPIRTTGLPFVASCFVTVGKNTHFCYDYYGSLSLSQIQNGCNQVSAAGGTSMISTITPCPLNYAGDNVYGRCSNVAATAANDLYVYQSQADLDTSLGEDPENTNCTSSGIWDVPSP